MASVTKNTTPLRNIKANQMKHYEPYWTTEAISHGIKRDELITGALRINPKNYEEAYITSPTGGSDIAILGMRDRNRALNGDVVALQLKPRSEWRVASTGEGKRPPQDCDRATAAASAAVPDLSSLSVRGSRPLTNPDGSAAPSGDDNDDRSAQRVGRVVGIVERKHSRAASGFLKPMPGGKKDLALFAPVDSRVPRIVVPMAACPEDLLVRPGDYANTLFIARITEWGESSKMPKGNLQRSLGEAGEIEPETEALLLEYEIYSGDFTDKELACLPEVNAEKWEIPQEEYDTRKDLRSECVFTIDPATARDLDDALSCVPLGDGLHRVGVHIADVSYFLKEDSALDEAARSRATSVYLVQKVIPMLPRLLCERLCSLNPDEDRLTFSVIWTITEEGEIIDEWFGRTIIRSCVKMSYQHAQGIIEEPERTWTVDELPPITGGHGIDDVKACVLNLRAVARSLRQKRIDNGALRLDQVGGAVVRLDQVGGAVVRLDQVGGAVVRLDQLAIYFCTGRLTDESAYHHYALSVPLYTHFTSPIRRYPDVLVHRLLAAALGYSEPTTLSPAEIQAQAELCNDKKYNAKLASERSNQIYFTVFVKECEPLEEEGMVIGVLDHSFDVLILKLGVVKRVYCEDLPLQTMSFAQEREKRMLTLVWNPIEGASNTLTQVVTIFSVVRVKLTAGNQPCSFVATLLRPE
ncbi:PREDICTED: DIS3-like exonuclease 2 [Priapulus caudatus]|uniref:DIS3-like exonuclease 2 n=1 Tax=Priapulus caudatus TaxID=37621 RepID=A0ABM1EG90_PRICU|nr:PREDICTED: DIS3-like exonuclease 2 [Priapulus caudatus]